MKSRITFLLVLTALINPISAMAMNSQSIACKEWANGKVLAAEKTAQKAAVATSGSSSEKSAKAN